MNLFCECVDETPSELISDAIIEIKSGKLPSERKETEYFAKYNWQAHEKNYIRKAF